MFCCFSFCFVFQSSYVCDQRSLERPRSTSSCKGMFCVYLKISTVVYRMIQFHVVEKNRGYRDFETFRWLRFRSIIPPENNEFLVPRLDAIWKSFKKRRKKHTHLHQGGEHKVLRAQVRFVQVERVCPLCRVWSEVFVTSIIGPPLGGSMRVA